MAIRCRTCLEPLMPYHRDEKYYEHYSFAHKIRATFETREVRGYAIEIRDCSTLGIISQNQKQYYYNDDDEM